MKKHSEPNNYNKTMKPQQSALFLSFSLISDLSKGNQEQDGYVKIENTA